jgi:hypothetical protein
MLTGFGCQSLYILPPNDGDDHVTAVNNKQGPLPPGKVTATWLAEAVWLSCTREDFVQ